MWTQLSPLVLALIGTGITFAGTALGAGLVFFTKREIGARLHRIFLGFAAGIMLASAVWSLLLPAIDALEGAALNWLPPAAGFILGGLAIYFIDKVFPDYTPARPDKSGGENAEITAADTRAVRTSMRLMVSVTAHNFPEGMAVGLAFALAGRANSGVTAAAAFALAVGIAVQNIPEGAVISLPLRGAGFSKGRAFFWGMLSGVAEPIAGLLGAALIVTASVLMPWLLAFAAGAMAFVVFDNLIPDAKDGGYFGSTAAAMVGFVLMMILDVALG